jgi:hypothetical protein
MKIRRRSALLALVAIVLLGVVGVAIEFVLLRA